MTTRKRNTKLSAVEAVAPEPHLVEKARMLAEGRLTRPLDTFDVLWHLLPAILLGLKFASSRKIKAAD